MRRPSRLLHPFLPAVAICLLGLAPAASASDNAEKPGEDNWRTERREQVFPVGPETRVRAVNPLGDLAVRTHTRPEVYLLVNWQHHTDDERGLVVETVNEPAELSIALAFEGTDDDDVPQAWSKRRADLTLFVPENATTRFATGGGKLEVRGTRAPTRVQTTTGDVKLRIYGSASVATEHGSVLAQMRSAAWTPGLEIRSTSGRIRVELPRESAITATVETRGEVTSDFSMEVERVPATQLKRFQLRSGDSEASRNRLELTSYSGPIQVVETLVTPEPQQPPHHRERGNTQ